MNILFCQGGEKWRKSSNNKYFTSGSFDNRIWERYKSYGTSLTVMFAEENCIYDENELKLRYNFFDENKFNKISLIDIFHPHLNFVNFNIRKKNRSMIKQAVANSDVVIIRSLGNYITNETFRIAYKYNKKIITEVTGPIFEGNYYSGFWSRICSIIREVSAKKYNKLSQYTLYVTQDALQKRYPNSGIQVGISDVYLESLNQDILDSRIKKENKKIIFGTAGSVSLDRKGQEYVIKALALLRKKGYNNIEYHMVGGGNPSKLRVLAKRLGVLDMIVFDGSLPVTRMFEWYDNIDVYICSSMAEGLCRSVVEAMSRACAVICTNVCGNVELTDYNFLYNKKDYKKLADLMEKLLNKDIYLQQCQRSYSCAQNYERSLLDKRREKFYLDSINNI